MVDPEVDGVTLRRMRLADVARVAELERSIFTDAWSVAAFRQEVLGGRHCFPVVAEAPADGAIVGYMVFWLVADECHLGNIAVDPEVRRRGIAQLLLDHLERGARAAACRLITLEVRRSNASARALYVKNDYYPVMLRRGYYSDNGEDALVMVKPLDPSGQIPPLEEEIDPLP